METQSGKINIIIIVAVVLFQMLISFGIYFFLIKPSLGATVDPAKKEQMQKEEEQKKQKEKEKEEAISAENLAVAPIDDIIVNPKDGDGHFLVITLAFEYDKAKAKIPEAIKEKTPIIKDRINTYFASKTVTELQNVASRQIYKKDIKKMVNSIMPEEERIGGVVFSQFVIQ